MRPFLIQVTDYEIDFHRFVQTNQKSSAVQPIRAVTVRHAGSDIYPELPATSQDQEEPLALPAGEPEASGASGAQPAGASSGAS